MDTNQVNNLFDSSASLPFVVLQLGTLYHAVQDLSSSSSCFCGHLKTELFSRAYGVNSP